MKIHYKHQQAEPRGTIAVENLDRNTLISMVNFGWDKVNLAIGITIVHPVDRFEKKIGRERSLEKMQTKQVFLNEITIRSDQRTVFEFSTMVNHAPEKAVAVFAFSIHPDFEQSRLEYAFLTECDYA